MKQQIQQWACEALALNTGDPNTDIITTLLQNRDSINTDIIFRVAEEYNVKKFLQRKQMGADLEEDFPLADAEHINQSIMDAEVKKIMPKSASFHGNIHESNSVPDFYSQENMTKSAMDDRISYWNTPIENSANYVQRKDDRQYAQTLTKSANQNGMTRAQQEAQLMKVSKLKSIARMEYDLVKKAEEFVGKFHEYYKHNADLVGELNYLYPDSPILKTAGLNNTPKKVPMHKTAYHREFEACERGLEMVFGKKAQAAGTPKPTPEELKREQAKKDAAKRREWVYDKVGDVVGGKRNPKTKEREGGSVAKAREARDAMLNLSAGVGLDSKSQASAPYYTGTGGAASITAPYVYVDPRSHGITSPMTGLLAYHNQRHRQDRAAFKKDEMALKAHMLNLDEKYNFQDIIQNDPKLSDVQDPQDVLDMYGYVGQTMPHFMRHKEVLRHFLQNANALGQSGVDTNTIKLLMEIKKLDREAQEGGSAAKQFANQFMSEIKKQTKKR